MRKLTVGKRLFWGTLSLFLIFAVLFIVFQQQREKEYKVEMLNLKLQDYNHRLGELLGDSLFSENKIAVYVKNHYIHSFLHSGLSSFPSLNHSIILS